MHIRIYEAKETDYYPYLAHTVGVGPGNPVLLGSPIGRVEKGSEKEIKVIETAGGVGGVGGGSNGAIPDDDFEKMVECNECSRWVHAVCEGDFYTHYTHYT